VFKTIVKRTCGYSLVELLVAVAILGLVISPLLGLFTGAFSFMARAGQSCTAINLCREKMETIKTKDFDQVKNLYIISLETPYIEEIFVGGPAYRRTTAVELLNPADHYLPPNSELLAVTITVSYKAGNIDYEESLESRLSRR